VSPETGVRLGRLATGLGWWGLLAAVLWACFLKPPPRSLAGTVDWLLTTPLALTVAGGLLAVGAGATLVHAHRDRLAIASLAVAGAWALASAVAVAR
jgi:hypothetical protein